jgi:hypothetical protein
MIRQFYARYELLVLDGYLDEVSAVACQGLKAPTSLDKVRFRLCKFLLLVSWVSSFCSLESLSVSHQNIMPFPYKKVVVIGATSGT